MTGILMSKKITSGNSLGPWVNFFLKNQWLHFRCKRTKYLASPVDSSILREVN